MFITILISFLFAFDAPNAPENSEHPGSIDYSFDVVHENLSIQGRDVDVYLPKNISYRVPVIVFGHGQALDQSHYELSFKHLAKKGIAVIHPTYDSGFFDRNWQRMAKDFNALTSDAINRYSNIIDSSQIIYSGHSKGAYVALMAAGTESSQVRPQSVVLFAPAGYDANYLNRLNTQTPLSLIWGKSDSVITRESIWEIYTKAPSRWKQFVDVKDYESIKADHFFPLSKSTLFGGKDGTSAYHYYGFWKWLIGAAWDLQEGSLRTNPYIYGEETTSTGIDNFEHDLIRSW